jgi:site-specific DNA recombinase
LVKQAFELYASGRFNFHGLLRELEVMGLRMKSGRPVEKNKLTRMLTNPFYMGLIRIGKTNETYTGIHQPLISKQLFDRVQDVLLGRRNTKAIRHDFLFRRRLKCKQCQRTLIGETHKGYIYYRCQTAVCPTTMIREEAMESAILEEFKPLCYLDQERRYLDCKLKEFRSEANKHQEEAANAIHLTIGQISDRIVRLTDAYVDRLIDKELFEQRKNALLSERIALNQKLQDWSTGKVRISEELAHFIERAGSAYSGYKSGNPDEKRELVDSLTSNRLLHGKTPEIMLSLPFNLVAARLKLANGSPTRDIHRTWEPLLGKLIQFFKTTETTRKAA